MTLIVSGLCLDKTSATTRRTVLQDVTLSFQPGEITLVLGAIGAGKSTLVECLAGICRPSSGSVTLSGETLWLGRRVNARVLNRIGVVWQSPEDQLFASTGLGEFRYTLKPLRLERAVMRQRIEQSLQSVGLSEQVLSDNPFLLSGGVQRRLILATTAAAEPHWLIADEPTAGLDSMSCRNVVAWFRRFADAAERGVIVVTHDLDEWLPVADRLVFMQNGNIVTVVTPTDLLAEGVWPTAVIGEPTAFRLLRTIGTDVAQVASASPYAKQLWTPGSVAEVLLQAKTKPSSSPAHQPVQPMPTVKTLDVVHQRRPFASGLAPSAKWICYSSLSFGILLQRGVLGMFLGLAVTAAVWLLTVVSWRPIVRSARPVVVLYAASAVFAGIQFSRSPHPATLMARLPVTFSTAAAATVLVHFTAMVLLVTLASLFSLSTTTLEMKQGLRHALSYLERWHLPVELLSLSAALVLRLIPLLQAEATRYANIARSRGKSTSRSGLRLRDLPAIVIPLTLSVLRYGESLSVALQARGYQLTTRSDRAGHVRWSRRDVVAVSICCLVVAGFAATRVLHFN